jgi:hypothetical protein
LKILICYRVLFKLFANVYELKYKWGDSYKYGYGWLNPENKHGKNVDIICHDGGVTYQDVENVLFIQQIKQ